MSLAKLRLANAASGVKFTEAQLEAAIIELLGEQGYPHVRGEEITREAREAILQADLRRYLERRYVNGVSALGLTK